MEKKMTNSAISKHSGLHFKDYLFYALGDFGICLVFACANSLLQKYYTDCLAFSPLYIMVIFIIARVWDAINDPIMGRICDKIKPGKTGKFKRYFLAMCMPLAISSVLMFALNGTKIVINGSNWPMYLIAAFTYILFGMSLTAIQIPYSSLASVVTVDSRERAKLSIFRGVAGQLGGLPVLAIKALSFKKDDQGSSYVDWKPLIIGVAILAAFSIIFMLICYFGTKERYEPKQVEHKKGATKEALKRIGTNRAMLSICVISCLIAGGGMFLTAYSSYVVTDYFNASGIKTTLPDLFNIGAIFIMMAIVPPISKRLGKRESVILGTGVCTVTFICLFFLRYAGTSDTVYWIYVALNFISGLGSSFFSMLMWGMVADAIDDVHIKTGKREDGTSLSIMMFFRKIGQCMAFVATNVSLILMGRNMATGKFIPTANQLKIMWNVGALIPLVCFGGGLLLLIFWFPISKKRLVEIEAEKEKIIAKEDAEKSMNKLEVKKVEFMKDKKEKQVREIKVSPYRVEGNIAYGHTLLEYECKYKNKRHKLLVYTAQEVAQFDKEHSDIKVDKKYYKAACKKNSLLSQHRWWFIDNKYYQIPDVLSSAWFANMCNPSKPKEEKVKKEKKKITKVKKSIVKKEENKTPLKKEDKKITKVKKTVVKKQENKKPVKKVNKKIATKKNVKKTPIKKVAKKKPVSKKR